MNSLFRSTLVFVVGYVTLMIPTYLLPWLGSNSSVLNAVGAATGHGMTPQWWAHAWCLVMLILMAWVRGDFIGKKYLPVLPFLAAVFDLTPGLSMIPLVPTALHLVTIILAVQVTGKLPIIEGAAMASGFGSPSRKAGILAGLMTIAAIFGSAFFMASAKKSLSEFADQKNSTPTRSAPKESKLPVAAPSPAQVVSMSPSESNASGRIAGPTTSPTDSGQHHTAVKHQHAPQGATNAGQGAAKDGGKVRYINLNE